MEPLQIAVAVFGGNMLTAWFSYGLWKASRIFDGDPVDTVTITSLVIPMVILSGTAATW